MAIDRRLDDAAGGNRCGGSFDWRFQFVWKDDPEGVKRGTEYCIRDVETERELLTKLRSLDGSESDERRP